MVAFIDGLNDAIKHVVLLQPAFSTLIQAISGAKVIENSQKYYSTKQVNFIDTPTTTTPTETKSTEQVLAAFMEKLN